MKKKTTKQLKNRLDNLTLAFGLLVCLGQVPSEKWDKLSKEHTQVEAEFYARRNHKQYIKEEVST